MASLTLLLCLLAFGARAQGLHQATGTDSLDDAHNGFPGKGGGRMSGKKRCMGTAGGWCGLYDQQSLIPFKPLPRGSKACPSHPGWGVCSGVGNCNYDVGLCDCPAGWQGPDCSTPLMRPCTVHFRASYKDPPRGHIDSEGRDLNPANKDFTESRCMGICDPVLGRCFCDGKYRRVNPPAGSRPGTPPVSMGRPLCNHWCQPTEDDKGNKFPWGGYSHKALYGTDGWCNADRPEVKLDCKYDGLGGTYCDQPQEQTCPNQCTGHGECDQGFCKCHEGWYGTDCARRRADLPLEPGTHEHSPSPRRWLQGTVITPPAAAAPVTQGQAQGRKRPLIYVYDLPAAYTTRMLQYRVEKYSCTWRMWGAHNTSHAATHTLYAVEQLVHELFLQSEHRTFDPEEADFFYMPIYLTCFIYPIHSWADGPWWHTPGGPRVMHVTHMMLEARDWVKQHFPWWDRRQGRDHIWLMSHDEGACYAPTEIFQKSIFLTHWGRMDLDHRSNTAYTPDNYSQNHHDAGMDTRGWTHLIAGHPCYDPEKDLVIPVLKLPAGFHWSPLMGKKRKAERDITLFFRGDVGTHRLPWYSRGIRQRLYNLSKNGWAEQHGILIGSYDFIPGDYSELLSRSRFCLLAPGDGYANRAEDAILHGCIPLLVMDEVHPVFGSILDWNAFSIRVKESDLEKIPEVLKGISPQQERTMRGLLKGVAHRFFWTAHPLLSEPVDQLLSHNLREQHQRLSTRVMMAWERADPSICPGNTTGSGSNCGLVQQARKVGNRQLHHQQEDPAGEGGRGEGGEGLGRRRRQRGRRRFMHEDDAFHTILQWLFAQIPRTR